MKREGGKDKWEGKVDERDMERRAREEREEGGGEGRRVWKGRIKGDRGREGREEEKKKERRVGKEKIGREVRRRRKRRKGGGKGK